MDSTSSADSEKPRTTSARVAAPLASVPVQWVMPPASPARPSVISGYPWFEVSGRETLLALPGLYLVPGKIEGAMGVLRELIQAMEDGLVPNRLPDAGGLLHWIDAREHGLTLGQMADAFTGSAEFEARYGGLTNQGFVERLYLNALDRPGEGDGLAHWTDALDAGALSRAEVVAGFAFSNEMTAKLTSLAADAIALV